jgi:hypothetical protein
MGAIPEGYTVNHFLTDTNGLVFDYRRSKRHEALCAYTAGKTQWTAISILATFATKLVSVTASAGLILSVCGVLLVRT